MRFLHQIKEYLLSLDIFSSDSETNMFERRLGRLATRVYCLLFCLFFILYIAFNVSLDETVSMTVYRPSQSEFERLEELYSNNLVCSCNNIAVPYESFINVTPIIHPICSSGFVSNEWISYVTNSIERGAPIYSYIPSSSLVNDGTDFHVVSVGQFQGLQSLCLRARQTLETHLRTFAITSLISDTVKTKQVINLYVQDAVARLRNNAVNEFIRVLNIVSEVIQGEHVITATQNNFIIKMPMNDEQDYLYNKTFGVEDRSGSVQNPFAMDSNGNCDCTRFMDCLFEMVINDRDMYYRLSDIYHSVPDFYTGCYPVRTLLYSSLTCFFDADCLDIITSAYASYETLPSNIKLLDALQLVLSTRNTSILTLVNKIFVEQWDSQVNYSGFYSACSPLACTYRYTDRPSFVYIFSEALSLIGGLATVLSILVPIAVRFIMRRFVNNRPVPPSELVQAPLIRINCFRHIWLVTKDRARNFNLFEPATNIDDERQREYELRNGRLATRLYIVLLISIVLILSLVLRLTPQTKTVSVENPTRFDYENLLLIPEAKSLNCRCTNIAVLYNQTMQLNPSYHPICRSNYSIKWRLLDGIYLPDIFYQTSFNFRQRFLSQMMLVERLCLMAQKTITNGLNDFYGTSLVSTQLLPINLLTSQVQSLINVFTANLADNSLLTIDIISMVLQNNQLLYADFTNTELFASAPDIKKVSTRTVSYDNCRCDSFNPSSCAISTILVSGSVAQLNVTIETVDGIVASCSNIESLRKSHLTLFFNQTAINMIISKMDTTETGFSENQISIEALNVSELGASHLVNTTVGELLADLFVEDWRLQVTFDEYYDACAPELCSYQISVNHSYFYIASFILGLIGGLATVLRFPVLPFVRFLRQKSRPQRLAPEAKQSFLINLKTLMYTLDIFSKKNEGNIYRRQTGILATRLYVILLVVILLTLGLFNALKPQMTSVTVINLSQSEFDSLYRSYPDTVRCPCTIISYPYELFITIHPKFHPVCAKTFLEDVSNAINSDLSLALLRSLNDLCQLANRTVEHFLTEFLSTRYTSILLTTPDHLVSQVQVFVDEFIRSTTDSFIQTLDTTSAFIQANQLLSTLMTNYEILLNSDIFSMEITTTARIYENESCDCQTNASCSEEFPALPGFRVGCYIFDALRQSDLHCFFDQECMMNISNLTKTLSIEHNDSMSMSMTVNELMSKVFVTTWGISELDYSDYFHACDPVSCTYSYVGRRHLLLVITIIIGIYGGLSNLLRFSTPVVVNIARKVYERRKHRVIQTIT